MTNKQLISNWIDSIENKNPKSIQKNSNKTLHFNGNALYSYATCIARYTEGGFILNPRKYSNTTTRHMSLLRGAIHNRHPFSYLIEK